jgi:hypothetical protein
MVDGRSGDLLIFDQDNEGTPEFQDHPIHPVIDENEGQSSSCKPSNKNVFGDCNSSTPNPFLFDRAIFP